jgi:hypothetical protein
MELNMLYPATYSYRPNVIPITKTAYRMWQQATPAEKAMLLRRIQNGAIQMDGEHRYRMILPNGTPLNISEWELPALEKEVASGKPAAPPPADTAPPPEPAAAAPPAPGAPVAPPEEGPLGRATQVPGGLAPGAGETEAYNLAPGGQKQPNPAAATPATPPQHPQSQQYREVRSRLDAAISNFAGAFNRGVKTFNPSMKAIMANLKRADESLANGILPNGYIPAMERLAGHLERAGLDVQQNMQFLTQLNQYVAQLEGFFTTGQPIPERAPWIQNKPQGAWNKVKNWFGASTEDRPVLTAASGASPQLRRTISKTT